MEGPRETVSGPKRDMSGMDGMDGEDGEVVGANDMSAPRSSDGRGDGVTERLRLVARSVTDLGFTAFPVGSFTSK